MQLESSAWTEFESNSDKELVEKLTLKLNVKMLSYKNQ